MIEYVIYLFLERPCEFYFQIIKIRYVHSFFSKLLWNITVFLMVLFVSGTTVDPCCSQISLGKSFEKGQTLCYCSDHNFIGVLFHCERAKLEEPKKEYFEWWDNTIQTTLCPKNNCFFSKARCTLKNWPISKIFLLDDN